MLYGIKKVSRLEQVPEIDFTPFLSGNASGKADVAGKIGAACEAIGFFYMTGHGIASNITEGIFTASRQFFTLPSEQRHDPSLLISPQHSRGYQPLGARNYKDTSAPDLMEAFKYQRELPPDDPDILAGDRIQQPNKWPAGMPEWRETLINYFESIDGVAANLLRAFALALDVKEDYFLEFYRKPLTQASLLHYPPQLPRDEAFGNRPHLDETAFTIVLQEDVSGLEVMAKSGQWVDVPPVAGSFVVNIGDYMARWTNDRYCSTRHRVVNRTGDERYSIPYFSIPDFDAVIECLATCHGPGNPIKYEPLHVGQSIKLKFSSDYIQN
jgi:isopenicillin N synthase-like dioxygenase